MSLVNKMDRYPLSDLDLSHYTLVDSGTPVGNAIDRMNADNTFCALVHDGGKLKGIFTDRDVLMKVVGTPDRWDGPVDDVMTPNPHTIEPGQSAIDALQDMHRFRHRNVPVVDSTGVIAGNLTHFCLLGLVDELLSEEAPDSLHDLQPEDGLLYVDFTGLATPRPVTIDLSATLATAIRQMQARAIGSILVLDRRRSLAGVITDRDVQTRVAGKIDDLDAVPITDIMTKDPLALYVRDPVSSGFRLMAQHRFSHIPLVAGTRKPVGIVSFRDLADYLATTLTTVI